ncbi:MAG: serine/threonine-protein kinase, partial [Acidimicrobiaceae bacterium]
MGAAMSAALDVAHRAGLVHRDVKPGNILLTPDGKFLLADFGIAKAIVASGDDLTHDNIMMGTAKYLSPEQVRGKPLDGRADLYGLGLVLYECLAGRVPFLGETDADTA